jgi:uncharacterized membrane protein (UPF0127 family)
MNFNENISHKGTKDTENAEMKKRFFNSANFAVSAHKITAKAVWRELFAISFIILLFLIFSCAPKKLEVREFPITRDGETVAVVSAEIARTEQEQAKGLMYRKNLPDGEGMLFAFDRDEVRRFWMKNTVIPLSIAYITWDGRIVDILDMYPNNMNSVVSSRSVRYALEVPQGWFERAGVKTGDNINIKELLEN